MSENLKKRTRFALQMKSEIPLAVRMLCLGNFQSLASKKSVYKRISAEDGAIYIFRQ